MLHCLLTRCSPPLVGTVGFFRVRRGNNSFQIESECVYAVPGDFTVHNYPCWENSANCGNEKACDQKECGHGQKLRDEGGVHDSKKGVNAHKPSSSRSLDANATDL